MSANTANRGSYLKGTAKNPADWRNFGKDFAGCVVGDHNIRTIMLTMETAAKCFQSSIPDMNTLSKELKGILWQ
jgi:hypothetical protein